MMCTKSRKSIRLLLIASLIISVILSGLYLIKIQADMVSMYSPEQVSFSHSSFRKEIHMDSTLCTRENLSADSNSFSQQLLRQYTGQKRVYKLLLEILFAGVFLVTSWKFFTVFELVHSYDLHQEEIVLNYIHNSDGKKRI